MSTPVPPLLPTPRSLKAGPGWRLTWAAAGALVAAGAAAVIAGIELATPSEGPVRTVVVPWSPPAPSADQVASARTKACQLWGTAASAIDNASNAAGDAPRGWDDPIKQEALANEARVILVESAYLSRELPAETPAAIRSGINEYIAANFDQENATVHRQGPAVDAAINRANAAEGQVNAACQ